MKDFFISYNKADRAWAEWIAWQIEEAGYSVIVQAWDFRPGGNFVLDMQHAMAESERTIAVLSPDYLASRFTAPEWAAAFAQDPTGKKGLLLPVRVRDCELQGLLPQIVYIDLLNTDESRAKDLLLAGIKRGRAKPALAPAFPGTSPRSVPERPVFPGAPPSGEARRDDCRRPWLKWAGATAVVAAAVIALALFGLRPTTTTCFLLADVQFASQSPASARTGLTVNIKGAGTTNSFILSDQGAGPVQVLPRQLANWYVEVIDAKGKEVGAAQLDGCPTARREVRLHDDVLLTLRPR
jgi:hypothetical protein